MAPKPWLIFPSEKGAERKRRELFAADKETVWLGETVFSLPHLLNKLAAPTKPILKRNSQRHLIAHILKTTPLKYHEKLKTIPSLSKPFLEAIRCLKRFLITPDRLEENLKETGTLREYDLLSVYKKYEALKEELGFLDEEDLAARVKSPPKECKELVFENFIEKPSVLDKLPQTKIVFKEIPSVFAESLKQVRLFSLPTPFQETNWFISKLAELLEQKIALHEIGILTAGQNNYYEALWQKLKNIGFGGDPSPFLAWGSRPEGRTVLKQAAEADFEEAPLERWIEKLEEPNPLLEGLRFQNHLLDFGKLSKKEWLLWLKETLDESPEIKTSSALTGLQWLDLNEGDFAPLKTLWVPGLLEGQFPPVSVLPFFQDKRDRARPEWKKICEAFPDPQTLFEKKRRAFLWHLSQAQTEVWLSFPRIGSMGEEVSPSAFAWDFGEMKEGLWTRDYGLGTNDEEKFQTKVKIEEERLRNRLETKEYHTHLDPEEWREKIAPMNPEHIFSPSQLETYAQCPFKYFAERVLNIPRRKDYAPEVDPDDRGTLFHDCLEKFLREKGDLEETVETVFKENAAELSYANPELYRYLKEKTLFQAKQLLQNELEEAKELEAPLKPAYFEWSFGDGKNRPLELDGIKVGGRIDRIDIDPKTGRFLVLDYKTGSITAFKEKRLEGLSLQLPLYILAVRTLLLDGKEAIGGLLIATKTGDKKTGLVDSAYNEIHFRLHKTSRSLLNKNDFEKALEEIVAWVKKYVAQIHLGYFSAQPKDCKTSCDYKDICRYAYKPNE